MLQKYTKLSNGQYNFCKILHFPFDNFCITAQKLSNRQRNSRQKAYYAPCVFTLHLHHLPFEAGDGELFGADEPHEVVVLEEDVARGVDNLLSAALDGYDHHVVLGTNRL